MDKSSLPYAVDDVVVLTNNREGTVRYAGRVHFESGIHYGIELYRGKGDHNGTFEKVTYFRCLSPNGIFAQEDDIINMLTTPIMTNSKSETVAKHVNNSGRSTPSKQPKKQLPYISYSSADSQLTKDSDLNLFRSLSHESDMLRYVQQNADNHNFQQITKGSKKSTRKSNFSEVPAGFARYNSPPIQRIDKKSNSNTAIYAIEKHKEQKPLPNGTYLLSPVHTSKESTPTAPDFVYDVTAVPAMEKIHHDDHSLVSYKHRNKISPVPSKPLPASKLTANDYQLSLDEYCTGKTNNDSHVHSHSLSHLAMINSININQNPSPNKKSSKYKRSANQRSVLNCRQQRRSTATFSANTSPDINRTLSSFSPIVPTVFNFSSSDSEANTDDDANLRGIRSYSVSAQKKMSNVRISRYSSNKAMIKPENIPVVKSNPVRAISDQKNKIADKYAVIIVPSKVKITRKDKMIHLTPVPKEKDSGFISDGSFSSDSFDFSKDNMHMMSLSKTQSNDHEIKLQKRKRYAKRSTKSKHTQETSASKFKKWFLESRSSNTNSNSSAHASDENHDTPNISPVKQKTEKNSKKKKSKSKKKKSKPKIKKIFKGLSKKSRSNNLEITKDDKTHVTSNSVKIKINSKNKKKSKVKKAKTPRVVMKKKNIKDKKIKSKEIVIKKRKNKKVSKSKKKEIKKRKKTCPSKPLPKHTMTEKKEVDPLPVAVGKIMVPSPSPNFREDTETPEPRELTADEKYNRDMMMNKKSSLEIPPVITINRSPKELSPKTKQYMRMHMVSPVLSRGSPHSPSIGNYGKKYRYQKFRKPPVRKNSNSLLQNIGRVRVDSGQFVGGQRRISFSYDESVMSEDSSAAGTSFPVPISFLPPPPPPLPSSSDGGSRGGFDNSLWKGRRRNGSLESIDSVSTVATQKSSYLNSDQALNVMLGSRNSFSSIGSYDSRSQMQENYYFSPPTFLNSSVVASDENINTGNSQYMRSSFSSCTTAEVSDSAPLPAPHFYIGGSISENDSDEMKKNTNSNLIDIKKWVT